MREVSIYCAGFPCTPFSSLGSLGRLDDPNSRQLFACVKRVKSTRPKAPQQCLCFERSGMHVAPWPYHVHLNQGSCSRERSWLPSCCGAGGTLHRPELSRALWLSYGKLHSCICPVGMYPLLLRYRMVYVIVNPCLFCNM